MSERRRGGRIIMIKYWKLKNPDLFISKIAKERTTLILKGFEQLIEKYCRGTYQDIYTKDDRPVFYKSNQRIDFMINLYNEIIKQVSSKLSEAENERDRRS
jgi:hypothetical protein